MKNALERITLKKRQLDELSPPPKEAIQSLDDWLKVELTYSSNAIEGNTLTRIETAEIIEKGISATVSAKPLRDQLEAANHAKALDYVHDLARQKKRHQDIAEGDILAMHKIILRGIDDEWAGKYRQSIVFVRGTHAAFPPPHNISYLMDEFRQWLEGQGKDVHPVRVAAEAHFRLVTIHPFVDGNGRTARLLMNLILLINGYPLAVIRKESRTKYLEALELAQSRLTGSTGHAQAVDLDAFYAVVDEAVERSLDTYLAAAKGKPALPTSVGSDEPESTKVLKIGELAKQTGEPIHTLRYWTKQGLLDIAGYTSGGYQLYAPSMVDRTRRIRQLQKDKRLTLDEIRHKLKSVA